MPLHQKCHFCYFFWASRFVLLKLLEAEMVVEMAELLERQLLHLELLLLHRQEVLQEPSKQDLLTLTEMALNLWETA